MNSDNIIKALDLCGHLKGCAECPLGYICGEEKCKAVLMLNALALIYELMGDRATLAAQLDDMREVMRFLTDKTKASDNDG